MLVVISNFSHVFHILFKWIGRLFIEDAASVLYLIFLPFYLEQSRRPRLSLALLYNSTILFVTIFIYRIAMCVNHANALLIGQ